MATAFKETSNHLLILWSIFAFTGNLICILLLIRHFIIYWKQEINDDKTSPIHRPKKRKSFYYRTMSILSLLSMTAFTISIMISTINHFVCIIQFGKLTPVFYEIGKWCIYMSFIMRLYHIYSDRLSHRINIALKIYGILLIITYSALSIYGYLTVSYQEYQFNDTMICRKSHFAIFLICSLLVDGTNTIILLTAYIAPVLKVLNSLQSEFGYSNYNGRDLKYPLIKISILTSVATMSSILGHIISMISNTYIAFLIDIPMNVLCVMLMTPYYSNIYEKICCGLIKIIGTLDASILNKKTIENKQVNKNEKADSDSTTEKKSRNIPSSNISSYLLFFTKIGGEDKVNDTIDTDQVSSDQISTLRMRGQESTKLKDNSSIIMRYTVDRNSEETERKCGIINPWPNRTYELVPTCDTCQLQKTNKMHSRSDAFIVEFNDKKELDVLYQPSDSDD